ncbi:MAG: ABC transporter transmembrane domain-containing protein [Rivularia sp. (in: cyanobacteria)]
MDSYPILGVQNADDDTNNTPSPIAYSAIYKLWKQVIGDTNFISEFKQNWIVSEFKLGDELTRYNCPQHSAASGGVVYLLCQGKVRLLAFDTSLRKEVSIQLLQANHIFGGDDTFSDKYQEYRTIAASSGILAQISLKHLDIWLQRYAAFRDYFSQITQSRQKLIFFKTLTELRALRSESLQNLLAYFISTEISAGSPLITASPWSGYFWLVSGEISSISGKNQPPVVGDSWEDKNPIQEDLLSLTDLSLFHLPKEQFDLVAETLPELGSLEVALTKEPLKEEEEDDKVESENLQQEAERHPTGSHENFFPPEKTLKVTLDANENLTESIKLDNQYPPRRWFWIYPFIQQQNSSDCGAASLAMISRYWGKSFSLNSLRSIARINSMGAEFSDLANAAKSLGYEALAVRGTLNQLELQSLPFIAHYQGNHYIVVWRIKDKCVFISDPAIGKRWVSRWEFEANFTGYALLLSPTELFYTNKSEKISFSRFYPFFQNNRLIFGNIIVVSILLALLGVAPVLVVQTVIDAVINAKNFDSINIFALGFFVLGFGRIALTAVRQYLIDYLSNRLDETLIGDFISHTLELPLSFFAARRVGDIISQIQDNPKIQRFFTRQAISTTLDGLMTVIYFGLMTYYSWQLTLVVMGFILLMMCSRFSANLFLKKLSREYSFDFAVQNSAMVEMITKITTIKTAAAESSLQWRWKESFNQMAKTRQKGQKLTNALQFVSSLINHLGNTGVLWYGTHMTINSQISIGEFIAFNMLIGNTINPILALVKLWDEFFEVLTSVERLEDVLGSPSEEKTQKPLIILPPIHGEVHFENVSFRYHQQQQNILQNISFHVKPGQTIGIVGRSGSGKSTLVKLLGGLYQPDSGHILIDGYDVAKVSRYSFRSQLGVAPQEFFLFSGTILENITLYNREFSFEQVQTAAKLSGAHTFIQELPLGYSTIIGERGIKLESAQQRKIAIARALVKDPRILILDEPRSCLDSQSEYQFQQNLARFNRVCINTSSTFRTTFIVAPSLASIFITDTILVLDRGLLAEQGTHEELMRESRIYPSLIQQQLNM